MKTIIFDFAHRQYFPVSAVALKSERTKLNINMSCDCDGDCGQGDCDCPSGPDSGDD